VTDDRELPTGDKPVAGSDRDFTVPRPIGSVHLDTGYTGLSRGADGLARAVLAAPDGSRRVTLWVDASLKYLMVYTGDTLGDTSRRRCAVAIEPMTCPPNAFRTGSDLLRIAPGAIAEGRWGLVPEWSGEALRA
jgi:aldose 1-epimerase